MLRNGPLDAIVIPASYYYRANHACLIYVGVSTLVSQPLVMELQLDDTHVYSYGYQGVIIDN